MKLHASKALSWLATAILCALALEGTQPAIAQTGPPIVSKSDIAWIGVGIAAAGAALGIGIFYAVHHNHSLSGCAVSGANGLELQNKGDQQAYSLVGAVNAIKPGQRVRVSGKRVKKPSGPTPQFVVEQLSKDYGPCNANPPGR